MRTIEQILKKSLMITLEIIAKLLQKLDIRKIILPVLLIKLYINRITLGKITYILIRNLSK
jgi:hypothetical protein